MFSGLCWHFPLFFSFLIASMVAGECWVCIYHGIYLQWLQDFFLEWELVWSLTFHILGFFHSTVKLNFSTRKVCLQRYCSSNIEQGPCTPFKNKSRAVCAFLPSCSYKQSFWCLIESIHYGLLQKVCEDNWDLFIKFSFLSVSCLSLPVTKTVLVEWPAS